MGCVGNMAVHSLQMLTSWFSSSVLPPRPRRFRGASHVGELESEFRFQTGSGFSVEVVGFQGFGEVSFGRDHDHNIYNGLSKLIVYSYMKLGKRLPIPQSLLHCISNTTMKHMGVLVSKGVGFLLLGRSCSFSQAAVRTCRSC